MWSDYPITKYNGWVRKQEVSLFDYLDRDVRSLLQLRINGDGKDGREIQKDIHVLRDLDMLSDMKCESICIERWFPACIGRWWLSSVEDEQFRQVCLERVTEALRTNTSMDSVVLRDFNIDDAHTGEKLGSILEGKSLRYLNFESINFERKGGANFFRGFESGGVRVSIMHVVNCSGFADGVGRVLRQNIVIKCLHISGGQMEDAVVGEFAAGLRVASHLFWMKIESVYICMEGVVSMTEAFAEQVSITELSFDRVHFGDRGAEAVGRALRSNVRIKKLALKECRITNMGSVQLAYSLKLNNTLQELDLRGNRPGGLPCDSTHSETLQAMFAQKLVEAFAASTTLTKITLDTNWKGNVSARILAEGFGSVQRFIEGDEQWEQQLDLEIFQITSQLDELRRRHEGDASGPPPEYQKLDRQFHLRSEEKRHPPGKYGTCVMILPVSTTPSHQRIQRVILSANGIERITTDQVIEVFAKN